MIFSLSWFDFCVTVNSPKTKCCGRKEDNRWFYNWSGVIVTKYGRKVTPVQKPPCSLADSCCLMISLWCKEGIKLDAVWSYHYSRVFLCTVPAYSMSFPSCISPLPHQSAVSTFIVLKKCRDNSTIQSSISIGLYTCNISFYSGICKRRCTKMSST